MFVKTYKDKKSQKLFGCKNLKSYLDKFHIIFHVPRKYVYNFYMYINREFNIFSDHLSDIFSRMLRRLTN